MKSVFKGESAFKETSAFKGISIFKGTSACKGFTLLEIIVVMMIISIAGSMVFMNIGKGAEKREIKIFVEKMISVCKKARMTALSKGVPVFFVISPMDRQCWIKEETGTADGKSTDDKSADWGSADGESADGGSIDGRKSVFPIPGKILIEASGLTEAANGLYQIIFYPDGSTSGGDLAIRQGDRYAFFCRIDLLTGIVSVSQEDNGGWEKI